MKRLTKPVALAAAAAAVATPALGQTRVEGRHVNASEKYDIAMHNPVACDDESHAAAASWRAAGTVFQPTFFGFKSGYVQKNVDDPNTQISFEGSGSFTQPGNTGQVFRVQSKQYFPYAGSTYWIYSDADIIINFDQYQMALQQGYGYFECGDGTTPSNQHDAHNIVAHEFGHSGGLGHDNSVAVCVMSAPPNQGPFKSLCPDAVVKMREIYAAGPVYTAP